jgi:raffinose/stachyose/melibiose transport system substrate-binding protein
MKMKRVVSVLLAGIMTLSLAACGSSAPAEPAAEPAQQEAAPAAEPAAEPAPAAEATESGEPITLNMWCIATESDSNRHAYEAAIADMQAKYPDINFTWEAFENQSYKTKIKAAVSANEMPDIFFTWSCAFLGDFVEAGKVYCLDDAYKNWQSELPENMLGNTTYDGKHYGVPTTMNIVGLFANMDLLGQVGYTEIPGTYDEFIECCDKLKAATSFLSDVLEKRHGV